MFKINLKVFFLSVVFICFSSICFADAIVAISDSQFSLGKLEEGRIYESTFEASNSGDSPLNIKFVRPSCGCIKIVEPKANAVIQPGQKLKVRFTFNTTGYSGKIDRVIFIETNDPKNPTLKLFVTTEVVAKPVIMQDRFKSFNIAVITGAGLVDGINPCAFTVLVFFISFLAFVGYSRKQMVLVGLAFILSVFMTYLLIGLGLFEFARKLVSFVFAAKLVYLFTGFFAMALGIVSLYDFWVYTKTKDPDKIKLKLPGLVKKQIQSVIREKTDIRQDGSSKGKGIFKFVIAAFSCGFIVSFLELICTGQLYLPTIIYIVKSGSLKLRAIFYLVYYNLMFVAPLFIVLVLGILGVSSGAFARAARDNLGRVKLVTAIIFFLLGAVLFTLNAK